MVTLDSTSAARPQREDLLSHGEEALWLLDRLQPGNPAYLIARAVRLRGDFDPARLRAALGALLARHEALRTAYPPVDGEPRRLVLPAADLLPRAFARVDGSTLSVAELDLALARAAASPLDLAAGPPLRLTLFERSDQETLLLLVVHHIATDLWSLGLILAQLEELYRAGPVAPGADRPALSYRQIAAERRAAMEGADGERLWEFWRQVLREPLPTLDLPTDRPRGRLQTFRGANHRNRFDENVGRRLAQLARRRGATLYMALLAAFTALLHRYSGQNDLLIGSPAAGRRRSGLRKVVGYLVNPVVVRVEVAREAPFLELLESVRVAATDAFAHQDYPFPLLVERLQPDRDASRSPIFQALFALQKGRTRAQRGLAGLALDLDDVTMTFADLALSSVPLDPPGSQFDLSLLAAEVDGRLAATLEFNLDLFDSTTMARFLSHWVRLLEAVASDPWLPVSAIPLLSAAEQAQLLREWNDTEAGAPAGRDPAEDLLHGLFLAQARRTPRALALVAESPPSTGKTATGKTETEPRAGAIVELSYGQLAARVHHLAARLQALGIGPEARVAVCLPRVPELPVALLATLAAGGCYVPLDPAYPPERLAFMLEDSGARVLITRRELLASLPATAAEILFLDEADPASEGAQPGITPQEADHGPAVTPGGLAYLIYTSGSTGRPKGVAIEHASATAMVRWALGAFRRSELAGVFAATSVCFDLSIYELFVPLAAGGAVILARDALALATHPARDRVTLVNTVPSAMTELVRRGALPAAVTTVNLAGEPLQRELVDALYRQAGIERVCNLYGPSEDTTYSTWETVPRGEARVTIGRPITGSRAYLLDPGGRPVPVGVPGELLLGGRGLARGYLGRPALTAERWVPDPLGERDLPKETRAGVGGRLYRTGDLARWLPDGRIEFLGRVDHQVKLRGFRIELGEIEAALLTHGAVREAVVLARTDGPGQGEGGDGARLVAYVAAPRLDPLAAPRQLRAHLEERLPGFMVPRIYVLLAAIPQTPNGKVDRKALPAPEPALHRPRHEPPRTATERAIARLWERLLALEGIGRQDDFFDLGGHSLLAARSLALLGEELASEERGGEAHGGKAHGGGAHGRKAHLRKVHSAELPIAMLFETPSLAAFAARVDQALATPAGTGEAAGRADSIPRADRGAPLPLSFAQQRLWFLDQLDPGSPLYNIAAALRLTGPLFVRPLARSLQRIVARHEALRTRFATARGRPTQVIDAESAPPMPVVDLGALPPGPREAAEGRLRARHARLPFDLAAGPVLRFCLLRLEPRHHALALSLHHIVADGGSLELFCRELAAHYGALVAQNSASLAEPAIQYADFAAWQREGQTKEALAPQVDYWREHLAGAPPLLELPTDRSRPPVRSGRGSTLAIRDSRFWSHLLARMEGRLPATSFMVLTAGFLALLHRYTGATDLVIGAPFTHRPRQTEELIGFFVNTLALRARLAPELPFRDLVARVRSETLAAHRHQDAPFDGVVEELAPRRDLAYTPLFQVVFAFQQTPAGTLALPGLEVDLLAAGTGTAKFDLTLSLTEIGSTLQGYLETSDDLFDRTTARRFLAHFEALLDGALDAPGAALASLPLLRPPERHQLTREWNGRALPYPREATIDSLLADQARRTPDAIALVGPVVGGPLAGVQAQITYGELMRRAELLATRLTGLGVGGDDTVALLAERSLDLVVALVAVLRAGAAYVPLDPRYPAERLTFLLEDSAPAALLTEERWLEGLPTLPILVARLDTALPFAPDAARPARPGAPASTGPSQSATRSATQSASSSPQGLAYVVYTSGSTGRPKGVAAPHRAVVRLVRETDYIALSPAETFLQLAPIAFDASTLEIWGPLLNGGRLVVPPARRLSLDELGTILARQRVTTLWLTSGLYHQMVEHDLASLGGLRQLLAGGDVLSVAHVGRTLDEVDDLLLVNGYGPTENTTFTTCHPMRRGEKSRTTVPIGRPIPQTEVLVLNRRLAPVAIGVVGELWIGGDGLARGYHRRPGLTAEAFAPDPRPRHPGERLYRSGDLARFLADGTLEFLGRIDHQVKLRGFRIELGEIQTVLGSHPRVREAAVVAREDGPAGKRLVAYVVAEPAGGEGAAPATQLDRPSDTGLDHDELRAYLARSLPEYMIPSAWVSLPALPLTANGKLDRKALPAPEEAATPRRPSRIAPRTAAERDVARWFAELLGQGEPSVVDDFFDLGGHSLLATQLIARVAEERGVKLALQEIFEASTVEAFARRVAAATGDAPSTTGATPPLVPAERPAAPPLSFAQERLWFLDQLEPGSAFYNIAAAFRLRGTLRPAALRRAVGAIVARHEALRTRFPGHEGRASQRIEPPRPIALPLIDLSALPEPAREPLRAELGRREARRPFDLATGPLLRVTLLRLAAGGSDEHALLVTLHHIVGDGWSVGVFTAELAELYRAALDGRPARLPELPLQYANFAVWQRGWLRGEALESRMAYWRGALAGAPQLLDLPTDRPRPAEQSLRGAAHPFRLAPDLVARLDRLARHAGVTRFMVLTALFATLLQRWTGKVDLVLGTPVANREEAALEGLIGFFVNTLPLRLDLAGDPTVAALLARVRAASLAAYAHQQVPFEKLVEELAVRDPAHTPLFQVLITLQNAPLAALDLPGLSFEPLPADTGAVKLDLALALDEERLLPDRAGGLAATFDYSRDLFDATTIRRLAGQLATLLRAATENETRPLSALPLLSPAERQQLREWNDTALDQGELSLPQLFERQARRTPELAALSFEGREISYRRLNALANRWAHRLLALGVTAEERVGVCAARAPQVIAGLLGALKAGAAYVPFDPAYPQERLAFMLRDSGVRVVLSQPWFDQSFPEPGVETIPLVEAEERLSSDLAAAEEADPPARVAPASLAYAIYTSGSTGQPKGVLVHHRGLANLCLEIRRLWRLRPGDRHLTFNSLAFDASASNVYPVLLAGATLVIHPDPSQLTGSDLERFCEAERITVLDVPPAFWTTWLREMTPESGHRFLPRLRQLTLGGDSVALDKLRAWTALTEGRITLFGPYGPTEATIGSTYAATADGREIWPNAQRLPIGRPVANTEILLLDRHSWPTPVAVPTGAEGELAIAGHGLARGYLGQPAATAGRFVPHPWSGRPGARLYRTGDLARWLPDGSLEFLGRADHQVKVRGFRIELGEIEAALRAHPALREAVVLAREKAPGDRRLVAYLVAADEATTPAGAASATATSAGAPSAGSLRAFLAERLPGYMVPATFETLPRLPVGPTGKVDREALPEPSWGEAEADRPYLPPRTPAEEELAAIWAELLGSERVGRDDDFFDLGGHSLLATQMASRLRQRLGVELPVKWIFEAPTLGALAGKIDAAKVDAAEIEAAGGDTGPKPLPAPPLVPTAHGGRAPMSFTQQRLWFLDQLDPASALYNVPGPFRLRGPLSVGAFGRATRGIVARHEVLRTTFALEGGEPVQRIASATESALALPLIDLSGLPPDAAEARLAELAAREARGPFDLSHGPLLRLRLVRLGREDHAALLTLHHIVSDGWSLGLFMGELGRLYLLEVEGAGEPLPPLPIQYADFAAWQRQWLAGERLEAEIETWRGWLDGAPTVLELPADRPRPAVTSTRGASRPFVLPQAVASAARDAAGRLDATLFMVLLAAFETLLYRYSGQDDLLVGVGVANRNRIEVEPLIGFFVNTLVMRGRLAGNPTFEQVVGDVRETSLAVFAHQEMPFDKLVEQLDLKRDLSRMPLVQVAFVLQNAPLPATTLGPLELAPIEVDTGTAKFDLLLALVDREPDLLGAIEYNRDLFDPATIDRLLGHFERLLAAFAATPWLRVDEVPLFTRELAAAVGAEPSAVAATAALTPTQRDLYLDYLLAPEATLYSLGLSAPLGAGIDPELWERAVRLATAEQEVARVHFTSLRGAPRQVLARAEGADSAAVHVERVELTEEADLASFVAHRVKVAYDLARGPLWRNFLVHHPSGDHAAVLAFPHLVADAYSGKLFFERAGAHYRALTEGATPPPPAPSFLATVGEQLARFDTPAIEELWQRRLHGLEPVELYTGVDRQPAVRGQRALLTGARRAAVEALCEQRGWSAAAFLRALWAILLHRLFHATGEPAGLLLHDVVGSRSREQAGVVGCLYQVLPVVISAESLADERPAGELIDELRGYRRELGALQDVSVLLQRRLLRTTGLRFFYNFYNFTELDLPTGASRLSVHDSFPDDEVHLIVQEIDGGLELAVHWNERRFTGLALPARLLGLCDALIGGETAHHEPTLGALPILLPAEREELLLQRPRTAVDYPELAAPEAATLPRLLAAQAERTPEAIALSCDDRQLSYGELQRRARRLASHLAALGVGPEVTVGLFAERSIEMVVALLAILEAGGAYLPLDPDYPEERLAFMVEDAAVPVLLTQPHLRPRLPASTAALAAAGRVLELEPDGRWSLEPPASALSPARPSALPSHPAYVIYTSGSTGRPKGVVNSHRAIVNRLLWMQERYRLGADDTVLQKTPFSFDVSVWEFFWPLLAGARLAMAKPRGHQDGAYLAGEIQRRRVTTLHFVPSMLRLFLEAEGVERCRGLRRVIASGEALTGEIVQRFHQRLRCELHNLYGPTEAAVDVTSWQCLPEATSSTVPIGQPIANTAIYIADRRLDAMPAQLPGELLIGGVGLARGYLGRPALTAERFVPDGLSARAGERLYRTGDLARLRPDGEVEFLGRIDFQVKIRGFRIELGEIEAALDRHPAVAASVVVARHDEPGGDRLVAYYARAEGAEAEPVEELRRTLGETLPDYMVPGLFVALDALPLSPNGKVDRRALPEPEGLRPELAKSYAAPRTDRERQLAAIWERALRLDRVGIDDNFFDLGGHSLLLAQVLAELQRAGSAGEASGETSNEASGEAEGGEITMIELFQHPTIASLAAFLDERASAEGRERSEAASRERGERTRQRAAKRRGAVRKRSTSKR